MAAYQHFAAAANASIPKVPCEDLPVGVPHFGVKVVAENNGFGKALKAIIRDSNKTMKFTYLPPRFVKKLTESDVEQYNKDAHDKKPPPLVFFGKKGKTFDVALLPFDKSLAQKALKGEPIEKPAKEEDTSFSEDVSWLDQLGD